jgi:hypothetical protein
MIVSPQPKIRIRSERARDVFATVARASLKSGTLRLDSYGAVTVVVLCCSTNPLSVVVVELLVVAGGATTTGAGLVSTTGAGVELSSTLLW